MVPIRYTHDGKHILLWHIACNLSEHQYTHRPLNTQTGGHMCRRAARNVYKDARDTCSTYTICVYYYTVWLHLDFGESFPRLRLNRFKSYEFLRTRMCVYVGVYNVPWAVQFSSKRHAYNHCASSKHWTWSFITCGTFVLCLLVQCCACVAAWRTASMPDNRD